MKISRHKKVNKYLNFYCNNFGFRKPFQVLIDGTFCYGALKNKLNIQEQLPKYLGEVKLLTTPCVIVETELLGKTAFGAMMIVKQFTVHRCQHTSKPVSGSECFQSMLGASNPSRYVIATQDRELQDVVRSIPGSPLLYLHQHTPHLEEPSPASVRTASEKAHYQVLNMLKCRRWREARKPQLKQRLEGLSRLCIRFGVSKLDNAKISNLKTAVFGEETEEKPRKRKFKSGPNPLSCKKKKKKLNTPENKQKTEDKKRKKRKRIKLPQHVKECLISNSQ